MITGAGCVLLYHACTHSEERRDDDKSATVTPESLPRGQVVACAPLPLPPPPTHERGRRRIGAGLKRRGLR